ncbi:phosphatidylglycerophosphatase A family protein [Profundibacterium mesophilum]|uniref:Phosphatidylglycerophosphatase A n=1 Tax=Profundibacterium mesophilum KAUST100406-0324 TaxID=1037889 RepID=A0A921P1H9_9RHOB|nr:phosphatidylglycerophosphatase A [Profundibacterium mesophilum]KAF0677483.1 putative Phosphatidylglycerophosphatase A [Profundibacterium mesophilum KAUST100406-0324]
MSRLIASFFYIGLLRPAPGTWGSLAALPAAWALHLLAGPWGLAFGIGVVFAAGYWATAVQTRGAVEEDPGWIVIDEVAGQWVALLPLSFGAAANGVAITALWPGWIAAFFLFRLFDIWKPLLVGWADRRGDALGVMLDDIFAGMLAALGVAALAGIAHSGLL